VILKPILLQQRQQDGSENTFVPFGLRQAQTDKGTKDCSVQPEL